MPANRERLYICPNENGSPTWIVDFPPWWDRDAFFDKYRSRAFDTENPFYVDYGLLLTNWEAIAWNRERWDIFSGDPRSQEPYFLEAMRRMETMLNSASWVIVEMYEWESGLS